MSVITVFVFVIGLLVGSFLNVVILRWGTGVSAFSGRSRCAHTGRVLPWYDLVPVVSFVLLRGRSRFSGKALSMQYPFVELLTGVLFVGVYLLFVSLHPLFYLDVVLLLQFLIALMIMSVLVVIAMYDLRTQIIPDKLSFLFAFLSLVYSFLVYGVGDEFVGVFLAGPVLAVPFAFLWLVSKGTWMGFGDAKLAWGIGWFLGMVSGLSAILLAFWIGAVVAVFLLVVGKVSKVLFKDMGLKSEIPFAPFLIIGTLLVFFFDVQALMLF